MTTRRTRPVTNTPKGKLAREPDEVLPPDERQIKGVLFSGDDGLGRVRLRVTPLGLAVDVMNNGKTSTAQLKRRGAEVMCKALIRALGWRTT